MGIVSDSAPNMKRAVKLFDDDEIIKLPCAAHTLNSCVKDLVKEVTITYSKGKHYIFDFNQDGNRQKIEVNDQDISDIEAMNEIKSVINSVIKKC